MENFHDRGVWIRIRSLKNAWIRFVLKGLIRIRSISDRIRNPAHSTPIGWFGIHIIPINWLGLLQEFPSSQAQVDKVLAILLRLKRGDRQPGSQA